MIEDASHIITHHAHRNCIAYRQPRHLPGGGRMTTCTCPDCGAHYSGSQRSGGHCRARYGGCCRTFANEDSADKHRVGPMGFKTCITDLAAAGFRDTPRGWNISQPMPDRLTAKWRAT